MDGSAPSAENRKCYPVRTPLNSAISEEKEIASCPNQAIRMSQGDWPKPVLPQGMACLRVPSPCGV